MAFEFLFDAWNGLIIWISAAMGPFNDYPLAAVTVLLITMAMACISAGATRALTDVDVMKRRMQEVRSWQSEYTKAIRQKDEKTIARLKKKESSIKQTQMLMQKDQMKPLLFTIVPFFLFYYIFSAVFTKTAALPYLAYSPILLPFVGTEFSFWSWYLISSFAFSALIQRLFRLPSVSD